MALHPCPHCGHPISEKAEKCPCCHQNPRISPEELAQQKAAKRALRKRTLLIVIPCVVVSAALVLAALFLLPDYQRYENAKRQMDTGEYLSAVENFDALGDYLSAADLSLQCKAQVMNTCAAPDSATISRFSASLAAGGYQSAPGAIPDSTVWYQNDGGLEEAQSQQLESKFCMVECCTRERLTGSFACMTHACRAPECKLAAIDGTRYCADHQGMGCKQYGCNERSLSFGGYCEFHQRNADERLAALFGSNSSAGKTEAEKTRDVELPAGDADTPNTSASDKTTEPDTSSTDVDNSSDQERKVRIYNKETGQWEWVSPDLSGETTNSTNENPHKKQIYCRHYDPETGTWVWGWVDE